MFLLLVSVYIWCPFGDTVQDILTRLHMSPPPPGIKFNFQIPGMGFAGP